MSEDFIFYPSFFESAQIWGKDKELEILRAIIKYGCYNELPDSVSKECEMALRLIIPNIDSSQKRRKGGKKGGRPPKEPMVLTNGFNQTENHDKPMVSSLPSREGRREKVEEGRENKEKENIGSNDLVPYQDILELFQSTCTSLSQPRGLPEHRKQAIRARWKEHGDMDAFQEAFANIQSSDFHSGRSGQWSGCSFDWILKPANFTKALELTPQQPEEDNPYQQPQVDYAEPVGWKEYILEELHGSWVQGEVQRGEIQEWDDLTMGQKELLTDALKAVEL